MKSFRNFCATPKSRVPLGGAVVLLGVVCAASLCARADLPEWLQTAVSASAIENALFRAMELPGAHVLYPRPPAEARRELDTLLHAKPNDAGLYSLRARSEEQSLDFAAAERDWKLFASHAQDRSTAQMELADFYHRRVDGRQEIAALEAVATTPSSVKDGFLPANQQAAWQAFTRALTVAQDQAMDDDATIAIHQAWIARYPGEPAAHASYVATLLKVRRYDAANDAIAAYSKVFPQDKVFPIKAAALVAAQQDTPDSATRALALYDKAYEPLWPADLVQNYFQLLAAAHRQRSMLAGALAELREHPDDLAAATRIFYYYQQQGRPDAAVNALAEYRVSKESRKAAWTAEELYTFATLLDRGALYEDAARYYFALSSAQGALSATQQTPQEAGLAGIVHVLLEAPERPIDLGSGNLSIYRDLATVDRGPGYLNGILSLWLNSQDPAQEFHAEEKKATPYFHRAKAAELLTVLDQRFPNSTDRSWLHAELIRAYVGYGEDAAVLQAGQSFLTDFPHATERLEVALAMADADARAGNTQAEFALYDMLLTELATSLKSMPLTAAGALPQQHKPEPPSVDDDSPPENESQDTTKKPTAAALLHQPLTVTVLAPTTDAAAAAYRQVLERYLGRLTTSNHLPEALAVLRRELDRNPNDPLLYARLADFLQQNNLAAQEEQVYQQAITRFNDRSFYDRLARFYLNHERREDFDALTRKVVSIFHGTELAGYFGNVNRHWPEVYLQLNIYAHQRFPHDLTFTRNLLTAYQTPGTANVVAWEQLIREHWTESDDLQAQFFNYLSRTHKLDAELASLKTLVPTATEQQHNPAAMRELAEVDLWQSHFEEGAPLLGALARTYPADASTGEEASSLYRSLAYYDPTRIVQAVEIEKRLSVADPANLDRLARIGDIYADSVASSLNLSDERQLALAAPFWKRMGAVHPGIADGYLQSATVFWDYFQFDQALAQIEAARSQLHAPALYGYEAGAIYENKRDFPHAIAEYLRASTDDAGGGNVQGGSDDSTSSAHARLLALAVRTDTETLVDTATASAVAANPTLAMLSLRVDVLHAQQHDGDVEALVEAAINKAGSLDSVGQLADFSQRNRLQQAYRVALQREIVLAADPVEKIDLQYQLARAEEEGSNVADAQRIMDAVYRDNPRILGVVRATADFYWKEKQPQRAIAVLVQASHDANEKLSRDYTLEAVEKSNESGDYSGARTLLRPLLASDPYNEQYLGLEANSYALANDTNGLRDFYAATLASLKNAQLSPIERRDKVALARQGMIAALTNLKDYGGAEDQQIALISDFPEDADVIQNAALYARLHGREQQLTAFLNKTVADSPSDSRFVIALASVDVLFENYDGALAAYSKAIAIRKDRPDLYIARADLEEHQQAFDAACADYERLYVLTYKDQQWMEKAALARARQGRADLAVKALQAAWIDDRPPSAIANFRVAQQLVEWNLPTEARSFADRGVQLAGDELLTDARNSDGVMLYAELLGRQRHAEDALALLQRLRSMSDITPSSPSVVVQQVREQGIASITDEQWRVQLVEQRRRQAQNTFRSALQKLSATVEDFYTPEEKLQYARLLDAQRLNKSDAEVAEVWIPAARAAGLKDREASWRRDLLLHGSDPRSQLGAFEELEKERMDYGPLAETLDAYAAQLKPQDQVQPLSAAAEAWRAAGDRAAEILDLRELVISHQQQQYQNRLFGLLLQTNPQALMELAATGNSYGDAAVNYAIAYGSQQFAYQVVAAHAAGKPAFWTPASLALTGLYFRDTSPSIDEAFRRTLADASIGERLQRKSAEENPVTGSIWFYYGMRYGVFSTLASKSAADVEDYLPAVLEEIPHQEISYISLAQAYVDAGKVDAALEEYRHAQEIDPNEPSLDVSVAEVLWSANRRDDAIASWGRALTKLEAMVAVHTVPETFWVSFASLARDAHEHQLGGQLKPTMDKVLSAYISKNGNYRTTELLSSAYLATGTPNSGAAVDWILTLAASSTAERAILSGLTNESWLPRAEQGRIYRREIELAEAALSQTTVPTAGNNDFAAAELTQLQSRYLTWLLQNRQVVEAQRVFDGISSVQRNDPSMQKISVLLAARQSRLPALLASWNGDAADIPSLQMLSEVADQLRREGDKANSRALLEYIFQKKLTQHSVGATDYLALANARIATEDIAGALDLLHRLTMLPGDLYVNLDSAADLLVRTDHAAEALPFLTKLVQGVPWEPKYRLRLGQAQLVATQQSTAVESLTAVGSNSNAAYELRAQAAEALHTIPGSRSFGSTELTLLAGGVPTVQAVDQPYFVRARIVAAVAGSEQQREPLLRAAIAVAPSSLLDRLRLEIFRVQVAVGHYEEASAAVQTLLRQRNPYMRSTEENNMGSTNGTAAGDDSEMEAVASFPLPAILTTTQERREFLLALATMYEHLDQDRAAVPALQAVIRLTTDATQRNVIERRITAANQRVSLASQNQMRRPVIHATIEQTVLVRPRLTSEPSGVQP